MLCDREGCEAVATMLPDGLGSWNSQLFCSAAEITGAVAKSIAKALRLLLRWSRGNGGSVSGSSLIIAELGSGRFGLGEGRRDRGLAAVF